MRNKLKWFFLLFSTLLILFTVPVRPISQSNFLAPIKRPVTVSATVLGPAAYGIPFLLYGYSSPGALVSFDGISFSYQTRADQTGYFFFTERPALSMIQESCLTAQDQFGRLSTPTCIPPIPKSQSIEIGPIILSPTVSFDKPNYYIGDEVILAGQTIPDVEVNISTFTREDSQTLALVKPVEAFSFPQLQTKSDNKGNFSVSLPSTSNKNYRLFAQAIYQAQPSPKSITLQFQILSVWLIIIQKFLPLAILVIITGTILYLIRQLFLPHRLAKNKALARFEPHELLKPETALLKQLNAIVLEENRPI